MFFFYLVVGAEASSVASCVTSFLEFDSDGKILESSIDDLYHFSMQYILSQLELYKSNTGHAQSRGVRELDLYDNLEIIADNYCDYIKTNVSHINANRQ